MKIVAGISILTNVVLAGVVVALLAGRRTEIPLAAIPNPPVAASVQPTAFTEPAVVAPKSEPFRWSHLESTDYPTYVANLRGVGCPEQTIRDIVTADVDAAIYAPKREELTQKEPSQSLGHALGDLKRGEDAFIASLLGTQPPSDETAPTNTVVASQRPARGPAEVPVKMPLVFQNVDPAAGGLDINALSAIATVRQRFLKEIGSQEDPNDPAYRERWKKAQADADSRLRGMIGMRAYQAYEYQARRAVVTQIAPQPAANP